MVEGVGGLLRGETAGGVKRSGSPPSERFSFDDGVPLALAFGVGVFCSRCIDLACINQRRKTETHGTAT